VLDGVNVVHPNYRLYLAVTDNPHFDGDSYVSKRWHRSVAPVRITPCAVHLVCRAVSDIVRPPTAAPDQKRQWTGLAADGSCRPVTERMDGGAVLEITDPRWADFLATHPAATPFHHPYWTRVVAGCYGFRPFALAVSDVTGAIRAGLPVVEVRHLPSGPKWVSLPYTDYCPPLVSKRQEEEQLVAALQQASCAAGVRRVEIRAPIAGGSASGPIAHRHVLALGRNAAEVYAGFRHSQVKRDIRRAEREGLTIRRATRPHDLVNTFYQLHLRSRRRHGVPVQPRRFFRLLWENTITTGLGSVLIAEVSARPIAAAVFLEWNGTVIYKFSASDASSLSLHPNHLLLWHAIRTACEQGYRWFDFGRTDFGQEGLRYFKLSWGAVEEPLVYETLGGKTGSAPQAEGMAARMLEPVIRHGPLLLCRAFGETLYRYVA
jgi:CelD/BcsL family acetyltransferase involved in cellulose biosynthesis